MQRLDIADLLKALVMTALVTLLGACASSGGPPPAPTAKVESAPEAAAEPLTPAQQTLYTNALQARDGKDWGAAVQWLSQLVAERPELADMQADYGLALQRSGNQDAAVEAYRKALSIAPAQPLAANNLALLMRSQGEFRQAQALLQTAVATHPELPELHYNLAVISDLYLLDYKTALAHYRAYQKLLPQPDKKVAGWIAVLERSQ